MDNYINYYYHLYPDKIYQQKDKYYFVVNDEKYYFVIYNRHTEDLEYLYRLNVEMIRRGSLVHEIIINKDKKVITYVDNIPYILIKVYVNEKKPVNLAEINYINISNQDVIQHKILDRTDWATLWGKKIDYFEYQISQFGRKFPILSDSIAYFIGLGENAISYVKNTSIDIKPTSDDVITLSHKRIKADYTMFDLYNPLSFIIDYKVRDVAGYIKESFFAGKDIWTEIDEYFRHAKLPVYSLRLLYARLLYPSYYFDVYENIIEGNLKEEEIVKITSKIDKYEEFLSDFYDYITAGNVYLPAIAWLNKNNHQ